MAARQLGRGLSPPFQAATTVAVSAHDRPLVCRTALDSCPNMTWKNTYLCLSRIWTYKSGCISMS